MTTTITNEQLDELLAAVKQANAAFIPYKAALDAMERIRVATESPESQERARKFAEGHQEVFATFLSNVEGLMQ